MMKPERKKSKVADWTEKILLLTGIAGLSVWAASNAIPAVFQNWENWVFDQELHGHTATVRDYAAAKLNDIKLNDVKQDDVKQDVERWLGRTPVARPSISNTRSPVANNIFPPAPSSQLHSEALIGRLTIPRLRLTAFVREGVSQTTLGLAAGHIPGTSLPGENGNVGVAGHRDTLFVGLKGIKPDDLVHFDTREASYVYQVQSTEVVKPQDVRVLQPGRYPELTLVTCYPFRYIGSAPDRFIVKAREVSRIPQPNALANVGPERKPQDVSPQVLPQDWPQKNESRAGDNSLSPADTLNAAHSPPKTSALTKPKTDRTTIDEDEASDAGPSGTRKINFDIYASQGRTLLPGVSVGIDKTDPIRRKVSGWLVFAPDHRTLQFRNRRVGEAVVFYGSQDGKRRELVITNVAADSATGYLLIAAQ
jgi:sortase A